MPFPLCSDFWPHAAVGKAYGVFNDEKGFDKRSAYVLDANGVVKWMKVYEPGTVPTAQELLDALAKA